MKVNVFSLKAAMMNLETQAAIYTTNQGTYINQTIGKKIATTNNLDRVSKELKCMNRFVRVFFK